MKARFEKKGEENCIPAAVIPHHKPACSHSDLTFLFFLPLLSSSALSTFN